MLRLCPEAILELGQSLDAGRQLLIRRVLLVAVRLGRVPFVEIDLRARLDPEQFPQGSPVDQVLTSRFLGGQ